MEAESQPPAMEQDASLSPVGSIKLDARPKKSILKSRSDPDPAESTGGGEGGDGSESGKRHVPFSHIIPELSLLEREDARLGTAAASDLQSVSSAASLSPLSSDEQLDSAEAGGRHTSPLRMSGDRFEPRRRTRHRRSRAPRYESLELGPPPRRDHFSLGSLSPRLHPLDRSPSPARLVRYSPSPERLLLHHRPRRSRSRSPSRRSRGRRSRSRSPRRRSRSPGGRYRRGLSPPRYGRSPPGRRHWSRSPSPRRRRSRSRSRSRSPPWGRSVERSLLALSHGAQGAPPAGYGPPPPGMPPGYPPGPPGFPAAPGLSPAPHPAFGGQPMPFANPPRPPMPMQMVPGANPSFGQPMYAPPGAAPVYPQQPQMQPQPSPGVSVPAGGISERIDSETFLREVARRKQQKASSQPAQRQLTDVLQLDQASTPTAATTPTATTEPAPPEAPKPQKLTSDEGNPELLEMQQKTPWMTQEILDLKKEIEKAQQEKNFKEHRSLVREYNQIVLKAKQKHGLLKGIIKNVEGGGKTVTLSPDTVVRLTAQQKDYMARRDKLAGELHQLKIEQKELDNRNVIMKKGKPAGNKLLHDNLKKQGELLKSLESVSAVVAQLKQILDPNAEGGINGVGVALVKAAKGEPEEAGEPASKSDVSYLLMGDETLSAVQVYVREQPSRASFGTSLPAKRIRLVSRPDAALSSVEFRHWIRAAVRQSGAGTLVLLASSGCLESEIGPWSAAAAVAPLLPLLRDLRADGLTRVVVVGVPPKPATGGKDRAALFNRALQDQLEAAGPHVPRVVFTPIRGGPLDGLGEQTEGGLTLDLYRTLLHVIGKCEQKQTVPAVPGIPVSGSSDQPKQLDSVEDASETLQGLLDSLRGRLAGDEAAGLGAVAGLLEKLKSQGADATQQMAVKEEQDQDAEDPSVFFRDPADHVCLHCKQIFLNAKAYLEHLKSPEHVKQYMTTQQNVPEAPWRKAIPPIEKKAKNAESKPIKGLDMFIRVECWYCKACETFVGDLRCASSHLKSRRHNAKYDEYLENNPSYHAVVGETRSRLLLECAEREEERTRQRRREEAQKRGDRMNERMRRQSEAGVQDVTDEAGAAAAAGKGTAVTPPAVGKKAGIKLNLLASPSQPPEELGQLKRKVQANLAAEQEAKRLKEEAAEREAQEAAEKAEREAKEKEEEDKTKEGEGEDEELVMTVSNQPGASAAAAAKVKITLPEKGPQKPAASGAAVKKKVMPIVGKMPKLRQKRPEPVKPAEKSASDQQQLSKSDQATLELANRREVLASIPTPAEPLSARAAVTEPHTEAISDDESPGDLEGPLGDSAGQTVDMLDLLDIDLPDADDRRTDAEELKMLGICDEDVAAQQLPATRPPP